MIKRHAFALCLLSLSFSNSAALSARAVDQERGVDPGVDYASLRAFGPWDDRNYALTREDLRLLAENEAQLRLRIPAFFRVELRRRIPTLPRTGPVQYPHSALPQFFNLHGGYQIDGVHYRAARGPSSGFEVDLTARAELPVAKGGALSGEARVTSPIGSAESAVAFHPSDTRRVIASTYSGTLDPGGGNRMHWSADGGTSWTEVALPLDDTCCDPTVAWSADGSVAYAAALAGDFNGVWIYRSSDDGRSWDDFARIDGDPRREIGGFGADKEYLHVDVSSASPHRDQIYLTWHESNIMRFSRSTDGGHSWSAPLVFSGDPTGFGSDITTDRDGTIFYTYLSFYDQTVLVKVSSDGGLTFGPAIVVDSTNGMFSYPIPAQPDRSVLMLASADADLSSGPFADSIYIAWHDAATGPTSSDPAANHAQVKVAYSRDQGASWSTTIPHAVSDLDSVDRFNPWIRVAPDGTVFVVFYDTRRVPSRNGVDLFYNRSTDGGATWGTAKRLTTEISPVVSDDFFNFGDYNGLDIVMNDLIAIFTDNRDETGGSGSSRDIYVAGTSIVGIFANGFESGTTGAWSDTQP